MTYNELAEVFKQKGWESQVSFKVISQNEVVFGNNNPHKDVIALKNDDPIKWYSDKEQPISQDLEEAATNYATHLDKNWSTVKDGYIAENEKEAFKAGAQWYKQQMMNDAMGGLVVCDELTHGYKDIAMHIPDYLNVGDKVKLIIIKED